MKFKQFLLLLLLIWCFVSVWFLHFASRRIATFAQIWGDVLPAVAFRHYVSLLCFWHFLGPLFLHRTFWELVEKSEGGRGQRCRPMWRSFILLKWPLHLIETYYIFTKPERSTLKLDRKSSNMMPDPYKMFEANHYGKGKFNCWQNPWNQAAKLVNIWGQLRLRSATIKLSLRSGGTVANEDYPRRGYC